MHTLYRCNYVTRVLKECVKRCKKQEKKTWVIQAENHINDIRKKLSYINVVLKCDKTKKQKNISFRVKKMCGSLKEPILYSKLTKLKHDLKIYNTRLTDNLKKANRARINWQSAISRINVFRNWRGKQAEIKDPPHIDMIRTFWANIWGKQTPINLDSEWYRELE